MCCFTSRTKTKIIFALAVLLLCFYTACADGIDFTDIYGNYSGQTVLNFLTIPVSATQLSRGITALPSSMDATDVPLAPSATAFCSCGIWFAPTERNAPSPGSSTSVSREFPPLLSPCARNWLACRKIEGPRHHRC